ncbi:MAG: AAA family ATPase [bacterium]|nr:AAA family ATPase [bacterium]
MKDLIVIAGAPGVGKTTISNLLSKEINSFVFDFGILREVHLDDQWSNASKEEEQMAFENLVFILKNYIKHEYKNVILNDLQDFRVQQIPEIFSDMNYIIFSLFVEDDQELKNRIENPRDSGWKDVEKAIEWNIQLAKRPTVKNEFKIDNTHNHPKSTVTRLLEFLK